MISCFTAVLITLIECIIFIHSFKETPLEGFYVEVQRILLCTNGCETHLCMVATPVQYKILHKPSSFFFLTSSRAMELFFINHICK